MPAHLLSSINQQKAAAAAGANPPAVKQELPMKLAKLSALGGGSTERRGPQTAVSPVHSAVSSQQSTSPAGVQQMLPMKLSQDRPGRSGGSAGSGYHRLNSSGGGGTPQRQAAQRTNTYPKMPSRPTPPRRPATTTVTHLATVTPPVTVTGTQRRPELPPRAANTTNPAANTANNPDTEEILFF